MSRHCKSDRDKACRSPFTGNLRFFLNPPPIVNHTYSGRSIASVFQRTIECSDGIVVLSQRSQRGYRPSWYLPERLGGRVQTKDFTSLGAMGGGRVKMLSVNSEYLAMMAAVIRRRWVDTISAFKSHGENSYQHRFELKNTLSLSAICTGPLSAA